MQKIIILFSALILLADFNCSDESKETQLQSENLVLKNQLDSLKQDYNILNQKYIDVKNKPSDTIKIFVPIDSINWIDSIRYNIKDSVKLIPHDTLITHIKDSLVYNFRDTLLYNFKDSLAITYDDRTFPKENIEKYLNLFFKTDNVDDTTELKYNFSVSDGQRINYSLDTNYQVPDSLIGWELDWYYNYSKTNSIIENEIRVLNVWWKETGLSEPIPISKINDNDLSTSYDFNKGYVIADLGNVFSVDSIRLYLSNRELVGWWLSSDNVEQGKEKYVHDGDSYGNSYFNSYVPKNKNIRFINISTKSGIDWKLKELSVYGKN